MIAPTSPVPPLPPPRPRLFWRLGLPVLALLMLALAWQVGPLRDALDPRGLIAWLQVQGAALGWAGVLAVFVLACCLGFPLSLAGLLAVLAFGPLAGALLTLAGATGAGALTYGAGRLLGRAAVAQIAGPRLQALNALAERRGVLAVVIVRLVPAAPYALVNLMLGATRVSWPAFLLGNPLGMAPMIGINAALAPQILAQLEQPSEAGWWGLGAVILLVAAATWGLRRWLRQL